MKKQFLELEDVRESISKFEELEKNELNELKGGSLPIQPLPGYMINIKPLPGAPAI